MIKRLKTEKKKILYTALIFLAFILPSCGGGGSGGGTTPTPPSTPPVTPPVPAGFTISTIDDVGDVGQFTSIAMGSVHISYYDFDNGNLKYASCTSDCTLATNWITVLVDDGGLAGDVGEYSSIALDSAGDIHISYYDFINGDLKYATCDSAVDCTDELNWNKVAIDNVSDVGWHASIGIDSNDNLHISYYDLDNGNLKYATCTSDCTQATNWITALVDDGGLAGDVGEYSSLVVDSNDNLHISYYDFISGNLNYATCNSICNQAINWSTELVDDGGFGGDVGMYSSIAIDSNGTVHISYHDWVNGNLKYATNASGPWVDETVDNIGTLILYVPITSLALDSSNNVHISYYDLNSTSLKYATGTSGGPWNIETIDNNGDVGTDSSIALDSSDKVHISYYDWDNGDLKYAVK